MSTVDPPAGPASLDGAVVVLTGAARGIGRATAEAFVAEGARVHVSDADGGAAEGTAAELGPTAIGHACDVRDERAVAALFAAVGEHEGRIDVLVNNAGVYPQLAFAATTVDDFDRIMDINVRGAFLCTMAALPLMGAGGSVVFLSSGAGTLAAITEPTARSLPIYGASKAALDRWALGVAPDLAERGIAANVVYPGAFVRTDGLAALDLSDAQRADTVDPTFVAPAVVWLARQRPGTFSGRLVKASELGTTWGPGAR